MRRLCLAAAVGLSAAALAGCGGGPKYAAVSGVVTVDGQPYKNAIVSFQPTASAGNPNPGIGSTGLTDDQGRYTMTTMDGQPGAVVGKHRVRIQTKRDDPTMYTDGPPGSSPDSDPNFGKNKAKIDPIPVEWYGDAGNKEFDVPAGGTDKANFDIINVKGAKKK